ncbi:MAG: AGE family epimerase/isomerase [Oligoflexia bacterium]|nr:AGE family epimerase/isomerase [Oligoflexia bacterium]
MVPDRLAKLRDELEKELTVNILPFWMNAVDLRNGGFVGCIDHADNIDYSHDKSVVLNARILWAFSSVYGRYKDDRYMEPARRAFDYLYEYFRDREYGGVYWTVDCKGNPSDTSKYLFAHSSMVYALSEFYRVTKEPGALEWATGIFSLIEDHGHDKENDGYYDLFSREWKLAENKKSLGSQLHTIEAYTNLYTVWRDPDLKSRIDNLISLFMDKIIDKKEWKFRVCFDGEWNCLSEVSSLGHNAEGAWLLYEASSISGNTGHEDVEKAVIMIIDNFMNTALDADGIVLYELLPDGSYNSARQWWPQCEAMVALFLAYKLGGREEYTDSLLKIWSYIQKYFVDTGKGWFSAVDDNGKPLSDGNKLGPWKCPYHNTRACLRLISEIDQI